MSALLTLSTLFYAASPVLSIFPNAPSVHRSAPGKKKNQGLNNPIP